MKFSPPRSALAWWWRRLLCWIFGHKEFEDMPAGYQTGRGDPYVWERCSRCAELQPKDLTEDLKMTKDFMTKIAINPDLDEKVSFTLTLREWRALVERSTSNADPRYAEDLRAAYRVINGYLMDRGI